MFFRSNHPTDSHAGYLQTFCRRTDHEYVGPIDIRTLASVDSMLKGMMFAALWDWLRVLCFGLLWILSVLYGLVGDMGLAIILLSLCVKVLMSPLTLIADRLQDSVNKTLALLQPKIDAIKQEYKGEEAHERVLSIYKEHDVHPMYPMKSLVGFLIQIPIFIAAFDMLGGACYGSAVTSNAHSTPTADNVKPLDADDPRHGSLGGYTNYACRCTECRAANTASQADYMRRHPEQREKHRIRMRERRRQRRLEREALR